jgi:6-phosphogluconolactonase
MDAQRHSFPTPQLAAAECALHVVSLIEEALAAQARATLAVSGGSTPKLLFESMAAASMAWDRVHFFWADERVVPPTDPRSNYRLAEESLIRPARVPERNVHRIYGERTPELAARRYTDEIREFFGLSEGEMPVFDVIHCGIGIDAHTASLFPGEAAIQDRERIAAAVWDEKLSESRITLLPGPLLAARNLVFFVTGADKAEAVRSVFQEAPDPLRRPAQVLRDRRSEWYLDDAAASLLE